MVESLEKISLDNFRALHITINDVTPSLEREENKGQFQLKLATPRGEVIIVLDSIAIHAIAMECLERLPELVPDPKPAGFENECRKPARVIADLDDRSIQFLLRECDAGTLINFLWYMKDAKLIRLMFKNMSCSAANQLMHDLDQRWRGQNPDIVSSSDVACGHNAVVTVLKALRKLIAQGDVPDVLGVTNE